MNVIESKGATPIFEALKTSTNLIQLRLEWNKLDDDVVNFIGVALAQNSSLQHLNLAGNMIKSGNSIIYGLLTNESMERLDMKGFFCFTNSLVANSMPFEESEHIKKMVAKNHSLNSCRTSLWLYWVLRLSMPKDVAKLIVSKEHWWKRVCNNLRSGVSQKNAESSS